MDYFKVNGVEWEFVKNPYKVKKIEYLFKNLKDKKYLEWYVVAESYYGISDVLISDTPNGLPKYQLLHDDIKDIIPVKQTKAMNELRDLKESYDSNIELNESPFLKVGWRGFVRLLAKGGSGNGRSIDIETADTADLQIAFAESRRWFERVISRCKAALKKEYSKVGEDAVARLTEILEKALQLFKSKNIDDKKKAIIILDYNIAVLTGQEKSYKKNGDIRIMKEEIEEQRYESLFESAIQEIDSKKK